MTRPCTASDESYIVLQASGRSNTMFCARVGKSMVSYQSPSRDLTLINSRINSLAASVVRPACSWGLSCAWCGVPDMLTWRTSRACEQCVWGHTDAYMEA